MAAATEPNAKRAALKEVFARFLRSRRLGRHFRRHALLDSLVSTGVNRDLAPSYAQELLAAAQSDPDALPARLDSHRDGLTEARAQAIRARVGLKIDHEKPLPWRLHLWHCHKTPFDEMTASSNSGSRRPRAAGPADAAVAADAAPGRSSCAGTERGLPILARVVGVAGPVAHPVGKVRHALVDGLAHARVGDGLVERAAHAQQPGVALRLADRKTQMPLA